MTIVDQFGVEMNAEQKIKILTLDNTNKREEIANLTKQVQHEVAQKIAFANENTILQDIINKSGKTSGFMSVAEHNSISIEYEKNLLATRENLRKERELNTNLMSELEESKHRYNKILEDKYGLPPNPNNSLSSPSPSNNLIPVGLALAAGIGAALTAFLSPGSPSVRVATESLSTGLLEAANDQNSTIETQQT